MDRLKLHFRKNCEGYFLNAEGKILARKSEKGFIIFPGGGIDDGENIWEGMIREVLEETEFKVKINGELGKIQISWGENWAKTEKQKKRYEIYQGDEMHFFFGEIVDSEIADIDEEDKWDGEKFMDIQEVIDFIDSTKPFEEDVKKYREVQIKFLNELKDKLAI